MNNIVIVIKKNKCTKNVSLMYNIEIIDYKRNYTLSFE